MRTSQVDDDDSVTADRRSTVSMSSLPPTSLGVIPEDAGGLGETGGTGTGAGLPLPSCCSDGAARVASQGGEEPLGTFHMWKRLILKTLSGGQTPPQAPDRRSSSVTQLATPPGKTSSVISSGSPDVNNLWSRQSGRSSFSHPESVSSNLGRCFDISTTHYNRKHAEAEEKERFTLKNIATTKWRHGEAVSFIHPFWLTFENKDLEHQWQIKDLHYFAGLVVRILSCLALALPLFLVYCHFVCKTCVSAVTLPLLAISPTSILAAVAYCCPALQIRFRAVFTLWCCWAAFATVFLSEPMRMVKMFGLTVNKTYYASEIGWTTIMPFVLFSAILGGVEWPKFALITLVESISVVIAVSFLPTTLSPCSRVPLQVINFVAMIIANFTVRRLEIYRRLRYLEYRFAAGQLRCFEDEAARFIKATPVEDAFYCIKESEIKLSFFDEHAATDPYLFYREDRPSPLPAEPDADQGVVGESRPSGAEGAATLGEYNLSISESGGENAENIASIKRRQKNRGTSDRTPEAAGDSMPIPEPVLFQREASPVPVKSNKRRRHSTDARRMQGENRNEDYDKFGDALACAFGITGSQLRAKTRLGRINQSRPRKISFSSLGAANLPTEEKHKDEHLSVATIETIDDRLLGLVARVGEDWDLNMFELCEQSNRMTLMATGFRLQHRFLAEHEPVFYLRTLTWRNFLREVSQRYRHNPYHNEQHGAAVAHMMVFLLRACHVWTMFKPLHQTAIIVAALVHDVGHFGMNNNYVVNSGHPLAITYNDRSVLENFHSALAFRIMTMHGTEVFDVAETFSSEDKRDFRKYIIELVLETDIFFHYKFIGRFRLRRPMSSFFKLLGERGTHSTNDQNNAPPLSFPTKTRTDLDEASEEDIKDLNLLAKACIRGADVGHAAVEWRQHYFYSKAVQTEFFNQGEIEKTLRLRISPCCDPRTTDVPKCQDGFITFISRPLFEELALINTNSDIMRKCVPLLNANQATWNRIKANGIEWDSDEALQEGFKKI
uniref:Phosphodiesterase n=1 Tax=Neospora caninum (strain Liverpool) TaxID=572307 RepID=A0A0F7U6K4_NEOCL|nr:TPA: 3'5'-cyclic nucleotide phosphodiesterase,putative [Neospora caninum Liverpool]